MRVPVKVVRCNKHTCKSSVLRQGCSEKTYHIIIQIPSERGKNTFWAIFHQKLLIVGLIVKFY